MSDQNINNTVFFQNRTLAKDASKVVVPVEVPLSFVAAEAVAKEVAGREVSLFLWEEEKFNIGNKEFVDVSFLFSGNIEVIVHLVDEGSMYTEWVPDWELIYCTVNHSTGEFMEDWDSPELLELSGPNRGNWPRVTPFSSLKGEVCVFWNTGEGRGKLIVDPENYNNFGRYGYCPGASLDYRLLVPGERERAYELANKNLGKMYH